MTSLSVPPAYREALGRLARLDHQAAAALVETVRALPPFVSVPEIQRVVREAIGKGGAVSADGIVASLLSVRGHLREATALEIASSLSSAEGLDLPGELREVLEARVAALLDTTAFNTTAVAVDLQTQHQRNFQSARIFTDLRPVFHDDLAAGPSGTVIVETLQLQTWNRTSGAEGIFVAMDEHDLVHLQGVVERALKKTAALRAFLEEKGLAYFELEKEGE